MHVTIQPVDIELGDPTPADIPDLVETLLEHLPPVAEDQTVLTTVFEREAGPIVDRYQPAGHHPTLERAVGQVAAFVAVGDEAMPGVTLNEDANLSIFVKPYDSEDLDA
jgi:hypothetical protein